MSRVRPSVRSDLLSFPGYHSPQVDVDVRLNTNESPFPPPEAWFDRMAGAIESLEPNRYPDREATKLRAGIAAAHGVEPANVFCGNGSNEVIQVLLSTYGGHGRSAAVFEPTYAMHSQIAHLTGTAVTTGQRDDEFRLAEEELTERAGRADIVFLCSPNNPTGVVDDPDLVTAALESTSGIVVVDEAYGQFASWSAQELLDEDKPLVVTRTFSKTWAMAGARLGYLLGPSWLVDELWKAALPYHLSSITQRAGEIALQYGDQMESRVAHLVAERDRIMAALGDLPVRTWPSQSNFVLFRPETVKGDDVWQRLLDRSVLVRNCSSWPRLGNCLRVTVGTPEENDQFLSALGESLK